MLLRCAADFGLSIKMAEHQTHVSNRHQGTYGYVAPEVSTLGKVTKLADGTPIHLLEKGQGCFVRFGANYTNWEDCSIKQVFEFRARSPQIGQDGQKAHVSPGLGMRLERDVI